jgi:hypothetical protein
MVLLEKASTEHACEASVAENQGVGPRWLVVCCHVMAVDLVCAGLRTQSWLELEGSR